ncbi:MAG: NosD domain-containing protein [Longimicrobiales bacterium]|nr:NosD domain-containing protein [Longimicrobiales bacterium]
MRLPAILASLALAFLGAEALPAPLPAQTPVPFTPGMVVTSDTRIEPGTYQVRGPESLDSALIVVRGEDLTLDLSGVRLRGVAPGDDPDQARGVAIRVEGGRNVVIRGGSLRGYRFAVLARGTRGLALYENDLSYGWKPRLFSLVGHESLLDWLSFHNNESREWMRFGAAVYLEDVRGGELVGNRAVQGMNGLLMTRTDSVVVRSNDFSYNSGLGIGMYRSSRNVVARNRLDYDVRGYSYGFYNRGQDSAGLLLYEQSSWNLVAFNSATHSGDGLFLWAGQSTMDTGEGGANDNLFFHNDFSYAPTNAVELTFSRNRVVGNYLQGSRYGMWGGYSWETEVRGNCFGGNDYGVAIEHGQDNGIVGNRFDADSLGIYLWARASQPPDWVYAQKRDVRSRNHRVADNLLFGVKEAWKLERSENPVFEGNVTEAEPAPAPCDPKALLGAAFDSLALALPALEGLPRQIPRAARAQLPRSAIVVDEWGPYDGLSPKLWPVDTTRARVMLAVLGPEGEWRVRSRRGVAELSAEAGATGDTLVVAPASGAVGDWGVELEYIGGPTVSPRGEATPAGQSVLFGYERFEPAGPWDVRVVTWTDPARDPAAAPDAFDALLAGAPVLERREDRLDYMWYRPAIPGIPQERWGLEATTTVTLSEGDHSLRVISDDGARVWVDGELVIDRFDPHGSEVDYAPLRSGRHELRVRYYQLGGWSELRVDVVKGSARSGGSAGPH